MDGHEGKTKAKYHRCLEDLGAFQFGGNCCSRQPARIFVTSLDAAEQQITIDRTGRVLRDTAHRKVFL